MLVVVESALKALQRGRKSHADTGLAVERGTTHESEVSASSQNRDAEKLVVMATRVFAPEPLPAAFREEALALAFQREGANVRVLTTLVPGKNTYNDRVRDVRRLPVKRDHLGQVRGYVSYLSFDLPLAFRLLFTRNAGAVVVEPPPTSLLVTRVICALKRIPYTVFAADVWADAATSVEGVNPLILKVVRWAETSAWKHAANVLTISPGVHDRVKDLVPSANSVMIGNGIDTDVFAAEGAKPSDIDPEQTPYFIYAGTVSEWQGADVFVDAFKQLHEEFPQAKLVFFSEGNGREALEARVKAEGIKGVEFRGKAPAETVATYLRGALAGLSSIVPGQGYEFALPTKMYAATACGTPVIHAGSGAAHERVNGEGLGWACNYEAAEVASAMREALQGENRPTSKHLTQWTHEHASLAACAQKGARAVLKNMKH